MGERLDALERFYPERLASRILGMGDLLTLIEKAERSLDREKAKQMERKLRTASFTLEDFLDQLQQLKRMGPLAQVLEMIPGFGSLTKELSQVDADKQLRKIEAIINSMTPEERRNPEIIDGSRKRRIARGSGTEVKDVNELLREFREAQRLLKLFARPRGRGVFSLFR
jgi:signal recognition particle subunit SRP54